MTLIEIQHRVADFDAWKKAFDSDPVGRERNGVLRHSVYRAADDPRLVIVLLEFASRDEAEHVLSLLQRLWDRVGMQMGFGGGQGVQARILEEVERVESRSAARG